MALIKCGECDKQISDRATTCPSCGAPTGSAQGARVIVTRAGGKWEGWGFVLIVLGMIGTMASDTGSSLGVVTMLVGFGVFIVGRLK